MKCVPRCLCNFGQQAQLTVQQDKTTGSWVSHCSSLLVPCPTAQHQSTFMTAASASWIKAFSDIAHSILHHLSFTTVHGLHLKTGFEFFPVAQLWIYHNLIAPGRGSLLKFPHFTCRQLRFWTSQHIIHRKKKKNQKLNWNVTKNQWRISKTWNSKFYFWTLGKFSATGCAGSSGNTLGLSQDKQNG